MSDENLIDETEAASRLCFSKAKLQKWRYAGKGPTFVKLGQHVRYRPSDIDDFVRKNLRASKDAR